MNFAFKFESLLKFRKRLEDDARRAYVIARRDLDECLARLNELYAAVDFARGQVADLVKKGQSQDLEAARQNHSFILGQGLRIDAERSRARELMRVAEDKQELLAEAAKERKILEKLKERQALAARKEMRRKEAKAVDDLVVMRTPRGRVV